VKKPSSGVHIGLYVLGAVVGVYLLGGIVIWNSERMFPKYWFWENMPYPVNVILGRAYQPLFDLLRYFSQ
jgi:hypothetical protein